MKTKYTVANDNMTLIAERSFTAPLSRVWQAWTNSDILDKWWGPEPYKAVTDSYSFSEGGEWRYMMVGPEGDKHYCINKYLVIKPEQNFTAEDSFCNEDWSINQDLPTSHWTVDFSEADGVTSVIVTTRYNDADQLEQVTKMGMKEGFNQGLDQLEALLEN